MNHAELLRRLLPPGAYDLTAPNLSAELDAEGAALDAALESGNRLLNEVDPTTAYSTLGDWERVTGLAQQAVDLGLSIEQRQAAVAAKWYGRGGFSIPYFIRMAEIFGFPGATVTEFTPMTCNSTCNDALYSEADRFCWQMNLSVNGGMFIATCNSPCDAALGSWGTGAVESAIRTQRLAHTSVIFNYV
jgi:uncharacterized protein YmfQ (DUF2313 family)